MLVRATCLFAEDAMFVCTPGSTTCKLLGSVKWHFLDFNNIHVEANERLEDLYQRLARFIEDNLLRASGNIQHHGEAPKADEELSPYVKPSIRNPAKFGSKDSVYCKCCLHASKEVMVSCFVSDHYAYWRGGSGQKCLQSDE
jgi:hypothetical protein